MEIFEGTKGPELVMQILKDRRDKFVSQTFSIGLSA